MWIILKYSTSDKPISHVSAIGPFDDKTKAVRHALDMRVIANEPWLYSVCELIEPVLEGNISK